MSSSKSCGISPVFRKSGLIDSRKISDARNREGKYLLFRTEREEFHLTTGKRELVGHERSTTS